MIDKPPVILYVEDEPRSRKVMQMLTQDIEISGLIIFEDSTDFLARAEALKPKPDVIFLDIHMQPSNGFEMLEMLHRSRHFKNVPIVAMTASVMNEEVQQLRMSGFNGCLAKPLDMDTFPDHLSRIISGEEIWSIIG